jgi:hypothetical protein
VATRRGGNGGEEGWSALVAWPDFGNRLLSASAEVAYVAVGAAAILSQSLAEAAQEALGWVLPRNGERQREEEGGPRG